jgi:hypothetical protein
VRGRQARTTRRAVACAAIAAVAVLTVAPAFGDDSFPELDLSSYDQYLGEQTVIAFDLLLLQGSASANSIAITEPAGYGTTLAQPIGKQIGDAEIDAAPLAGGKVERYPGTLVTTEPTADALATACAPGSHAATWHLALNSLASVVVPIVVDRLPGGNYRMTACLDTLRVAGLKPVEVYFTVRTVFRNPTRKGVYRWSAIVTPTSAAGTPDPGTAFEMRADEPLPETLDSTASYDKKSRTLTIKGTLRGAGAPRVGIRVHLLAGATPNADKMKEIGIAQTSKSGAYVFTKRLAPPRYVYAYVYAYRAAGCDQGSTAPAGCVSESTDGAGSGALRPGG